MLAGDEEGEAEAARVADDRCNPAVLDFLQSTHVGRTAPPVRKTGTVRDRSGSRGSREDGVQEAEEDGVQEAEADGVEEQAE